MLNLISDSISETLEEFGVQLTDAQLEELAETIWADVEMGTPLVGGTYLSEEAPDTSSHKDLQTALDYIRNAHPNRFNVVIGEEGHDYPSERDAEEIKAIMRRW